MVPAHRVHLSGAGAVTAAPTSGPYSGAMKSDNTDPQKTPDGSTTASDTEKAKAEALPDGSQSDGTSETDEDTASGGPAD